MMRLPLRQALVAILVGLAGGATGTARANASDLLDVLHANHTITDAQYARLKQQQALGEQKTVKPQALAEAPKSFTQLPRIDGYGQFDIPLAVSDASLLGSSTNLRRFYVHIHDQIAPSWAYSTTFGYFSGKTYFVGADIRYRGFRHLTVTGGYFKEPFSLSYLTSPKNLLFPERPLPVMALSPGKKIGVQMATHGDRWTLAAGIFGGGYNQTATSGVVGRWGESVRATVTPWRTAGSLWELGASYAWRRADSSRREVFGYLPESFVVGTRLATTSSIRHVTSFSTRGLETLLQTHAMAVQSEYLMTRVHRADAPTLTFPGWYVQASLALTGEQRHYSPGMGTLGGITPRHTVSQGGWGAWELAARYSTLDLNSGDISGGQERNASFGVNWYPEKPLKFMFDAIRILPLHGGPHPRQDSTIIMARLQAAY
ncbi:MAG: hypothetical protein EPN74_09230 [Rhodanobacter sp.]|nr:MAG: hypothetical protein EPN74_09230 [Rhodanobacter sp.]